MAKTVDEYVDGVINGRKIEELNDDEIKSIYSVMQSGTVPEEKKEVIQEEKPKVVEIPKKEATTSQPAPATKPEFDYDKFGKIIQRDPAEAFDYAFETKYGVAPGKIMPAVIQTMAQMVTRMADMESRMHGGPDSERAILDQVIAENGLTKDARGYELARKVAKADGLIGAPKPTETPKPEPVPRLPRGQSGESLGNEDERMFSNLHNLPDEALEKVAKRFGLVNQSHLT